MLTEAHVLKIISSDLIGLFILILPIGRTRDCIPKLDKFLEPFLLVFGKLRSP